MVEKLNNVTLTTWSYFPSNSIVVHSKDDKRAYEKLGYKVAKGSYGRYIMTRPAEVYLYYIVDGEEREQSIKKMILDYYGAKRITESKAYEFMADMVLGNILLGYDEENGFQILDECN